jgi:chromosome segregation ATPase
MKNSLSHKLMSLFIVALLIGAIHPNTAFAAEKDKSARRAALMMQKMKQDMQTQMDADKAAMQAQLDTQKKESDAKLLNLEAKLKSKEEQLAIVSKKIAAAESKNNALESDGKKITLEKTAIETKQQQTQTLLENTQKSLDELKTQHQQALADIKFNDNQRKTLSTNLAQTTKSVNECEAKNAKLHQFGSELIQIYDKPANYEATMRKEQFFQLKRVELENILQGYQDKLDDVRFENKKLAY